MQKEGRLLKLNQGFGKELANYGASDQKFTRMLQDAGEAIPQLGGVVPQRMPFHTPPPLGPHHIGHWHCQ